MKPAKVTLACIISALLALSGVAPAHAQELSVLGGVSNSPQTNNGSYAWQLEYRHRLLKPLSLGVSYLNEGHLTGHHRDGYAPQLWTHLPLFHDRVELSAGAGAYFYFDTVPSDSSPSDYRNEHGAKALTSLDATWYSESKWYLRLQGNYLALGSSVDTFTALAGVGYRFTPEPSKSSPDLPFEVPASEFTLLLGQTVANSFDSQRSVATEVEYRHRFIPHVEGSLAFLYEGDSRLIRRDGVITELWATQDLLDNRVGVGIGGGAYFDIESYSSLKSERVSGIITLTATYRFSRRVAARASWNRIVTNYDRDSDVIVAGVGYLF